MTRYQIRAFRETSRAYRLYSHMDVRHPEFTIAQELSERLTERAGLMFGLPGDTTCSRLYRISHGTAGAAVRVDDFPPKDVTR